MFLTFYETPVFRKKLDELTSLETLYAIQADLLDDPKRWPVIRGTNGARKGRIAEPGSQEGKSGSFRYIYFFLEHQGQIYLLYLLDKKKQANLNAKQTKIVAAMVEAIKKAARKELK